MSESDLIEKQKNVLQQENVKLQQELTNANKKSSDWEVLAGTERRYKEEAIKDRSDARRELVSVKKSVQHTTLQRNCFFITVVTYLGFMVVLNHVSIFASLLRFVGYLIQNYIIAVIVAVGLFLVLAFLIYNQKRYAEANKKDGYEKAVYLVNMVFLMLMGAVTGFYKYIPVTYPTCIIGIFTAYQIVKTMVKSRYTY